jgi:hypothetical protein
MKKIALLICLAIITSCSNDEKIDAESNEIFHPPVWIQGTWGFKTSDYQMAMFVFTSNDFIWGTSYKNEMELYRKMGMEIIVTEEITNSVYIIRLHSEPLYRFKKIDSNHISSEILNGSGNIWTLNKL